MLSELSENSDSGAEYISDKKKCEMYYDMIRKGEYEKAFRECPKVGFYRITFNDHIKYSSIPPDIIKKYCKYQDTNDYTWIKFMINKYKYEFSIDEKHIICKYLNFFDDNIIFCTDQIYNLCFHDDYVNKYCSDINLLKDFIKKHKIRLSPKKIIDKVISSDSKMKFVFDNSVRIIEKLYGIDNKITKYIFESYFKNTCKHYFFTNVKLNITDLIFLDICGALENVKCKYSNYRRQYHSNSMYEFMNYFLTQKIKIQSSQPKELINNIIYNMLYNSKNDLVSRCNKCPMGYYNSLLTLANIHCGTNILTSNIVYKNSNANCNHYYFNNGDNSSDDDIDDDRWNEIEQYQLIIINTLIDKIMELFEFNPNIISNIKELKIRLNHEIDDLTDVNMQEYIKYLCINKNLNKIKYILDNKILILTEDIKSTIIYHLYNFDDNELLKVLELFSNYGLIIDGKIINYLYNINIKINTPTTLGNTINTEFKKYPKKLFKFKSTKIIKNHLYLLRFEQFSINAKNIPNDYYVSLGNNDTRVFEYLVEKYNYKPTVQEICDMNNNKFKHALLLRFY